MMTAQVSDCTTAEPEPWDKTQIGIVAFLGFLAVTVICATSADLVRQSKPVHRENRGPLLTLVTAFSAVANTRALYHVADKAYPNHCSLQFFHGIRFLSGVFVVLGHFYLIGNDVFARLLYLFIAPYDWDGRLIGVAYNTIDTFLFLSGFLLCLVITKKRRSGPGVFLFAVLRRLIRTCIPLFFVIMCLYATPRLVNGPHVKTFFKTFYDGIDKEWWRLLLQIRNFSLFYLQSPLIQMWYLSADFQLHIVSLLVLLIFKNRKGLAVGTFAMLSLLGCAITMWTAADDDISPVIIFPDFSPSLLFKTFNFFYMRPSYHAVSYFSGCIAFLIADDFRNWKMPRSAERAGWCAAVISALCVVFMKFPWQRSADPASQVLKLFVSASDRVLWSFFIGWITLACYSGRGGVVNRLLSWNAFVPLSKLSFGVYLIHYPFMMLMLHASRERIQASHFTQVSLFFVTLIWSLLLAHVQFLMCEAPTAALDKLAFRAHARKGRDEWKSQPDADCGAAEEEPNGAERFRSRPDSDPSSAHHPSQSLRQRSLRF